MTHESTSAALTRRAALAALGSAGAALALAGCGGSSPTAPSSGATGTTGVASTNASCAVTPTETLGPYPSLVDLVRSDIRDGRAGTPLTLTIRVLNANQACAAVSGAAVEIWQCDAQGNYSQYGSQAGQTYLRGIQVTGANGEVQFTTIYPGWYQGRATHIHVEVSLGGVSRTVTQIAFPESVSNTVHATGVYASRGSNPTTNARDSVFSDGVSSELVTPVGDPTGGYSGVFQIVTAL